MRSESLGACEDVGAAPCDRERGQLQKSARGSGLFL